MTELSEAQESFERKIQLALKLSVPYSPRTLGQAVPEVDTPAAVLILFAWEKGKPRLLLTKRTEFVETHKGQYAFPGGRIEDNDRSSILAALRETEEEVGVPLIAVRVLGELPGLRTPTGYWITPVIGFLNRVLEQTPLKMSAEETAEAFWVDFGEFSQEGVYSCERFELGSGSFPVHVYQLGDRRIWGVTGAMLKNLLDRLAEVG
ncbi:MAG TPA: CoA pyrophosphatase [Bdellovibrionales bacterium]|nr:MAG: hypothetical protein A2Z97_05050 [Bdellovibrionales bacterium GWB1_52_6]OFZ04558.1 MAG: hypothetical protein A2X97_13130 [Bdellovibrionales bacterium GWA1_52_35]OFZ42937.1 MAG: hypothetical protein A2070_10285 [Bdellovibrionales bacterium GWC1_52_8]HAR43648.1 CoA pyrophosphatase [Bdellovibrionales bacterium]HCM39969.1 CoA pyrophosphatase [Bdellovibrionales bacterium]